jgi:hypothetical protein
VRTAPLLAVTVFVAACAEGDPMGPGADRPDAAALLFSTETTYKGHATAVRASVPLLGLNVKLSEAGPLPKTGGYRSSSLLLAVVPKLLNVGLLHSTTIAQGSRSFAESAVAQLSLNVLGIDLDAELIRATAKAVCHNGNESFYGKSEIVDLRIDGKRITVTGHPNQTIKLLLGKIIINEQVKTSSGITVNAIHIIVPGLADVVISSATAGIDCGRDCPPPIGDFATGVGAILTPASVKAEFVLSAGIGNDGKPYGEFRYLEVKGGPRLENTTITKYEIVDGMTRRLEGTGTWQGSPVTWQATLSDADGNGTDVFVISMSNGYQAGGSIVQGDITIHTAPVDCK